MSVFDCLLIGHLLGDWVLQNDWMAKGKRQGLLTWAGLIHFTIYTAATVGFLWLFGPNEAAVSYLYLGLIIFVSHWLIDATDGVKRWMRFYRQSHVVFMQIMVDQSLHVLVLGLVTMLLT